MPQATSAAKSRNAQEARRKAAQRSSASRRRSRPQRPSAKPASSAESMVEQSANLISNSDTLLSGKDILDDNQASEMVSETSATEAEVDQLCELVEVNPTALGSKANSVRQLCRDRRQALASRGKAAVPGKNGGKSMGTMAFSKSSTRGRDLARQRRAEKASIGRGSKPKARPTRPPRDSQVPPKVEIGTTLSGQEVSGTQVERSNVVTGSEQGSCLPITGTEYIGSEQFNAFCGVQPEPNAPKVGVSLTGAGRSVSGTEVGRAENVTGDEQGSCVNVTGSEYVGAEKLSGFCGTTPSAAPAKVMSSRTEDKQIRITGADEARVNSTTGNEAGSDLKITGDQYAAAGAGKLTINGPKKVALTHTIAGQEVTGTEVGRSAKVTGDEHGSSSPVSGTEYLSNEQFESVYGTASEPHPAKVGVDSSAHGQRITGALVDRSENVTGNEPGSCAHLTGSQYGQSKLCGGVAPKVHQMQTLGGSSLTGNQIDSSSSMTGDDHGECLPVTGTEYHGQDQFAVCPTTPAPKPEKVGVEHTPKGQHVSGTMVNDAQNVTGNEFGADHPVSGTPYAGAKVPANHGACCDECAARDAAKAAGLIASSGQQNPMQQAVPTAPAGVPQDFSIVSPARAAQVTGSRYGGSRVTGPGDMAVNRISGTPEFRYPETRHIAAAPAPVVMAAPQAIAHQAPAPVESEIVKHSQNITGEGREDGVSVTGDNWGRSPGMTGTEGHIVKRRNPSLKAQESHEPANNAHQNKNLELPDAAPLIVTGSSGNTGAGAVITVSGGARG